MAQTDLWTRSALIVEDDDVVARLLQFILQGEGYRVTRVADGTAARALIAAELPPDLVTLDGILPDTTGRELLESMRASPEWKHVPVLILSADAQDDIEPSIDDAGISGYMQKPFSAEELRACIARLLKGTSLHRVHRRATVSVARHGRRY
jgi:DNA-binding response OmpR family regulator